MRTRRISCHNLQAWAGVYRGGRTLYSLFSSANLIDAIQNEPIIWDTTVNASEEEKEMAWRRISDLFGLPSGMFCKYCISLH